MNENYDNNSSFVHDKRHFQIPQFNYLFGLKLQCNNSNENLTSNNSVEGKIIVILSLQEVESYEHFFAASLWYLYVNCLY